MTKIAINGLGRIGRATFKVVLEKSELELVAVNDITPVDDLLYLLKYDSVYGRYGKDLSKDGGDLKADGKKVKVLSEKDPLKLPWKELGVEIVFECTGRFTAREDLQKHLDAGARRVILSAPPKGEGVPVIMPGINEPDASMTMISAASCTTNCIAPVMEIIGRRIGIEKALMTTVHAYTSSQAIVDMPNKKRRRGRAGAVNFVPTSTGAAKATAKALPQFNGIFDGTAIRGPVPAGSIADVTVLTKKKTTAEELNAVFSEESETARYKGILGVNNDGMVSGDIIGDTRASVVDIGLTMVVDNNLVKIMSWYDNEWGYVNQMVRNGLKLAHL